jgi:hypothetical protein
MGLVGESVMNVTEFEREKGLVPYGVQSEEADFHVHVDTKFGYFCIYKHFDIMQFVGMHHVPLAPINTQQEWNYEKYEYKEIWISFRDIYSSGELTARGFNLRKEKLADGSDIPISIPIPVTWFRMPSQFMHNERASSKESGDIAEDIFAACADKLQCTITRKCDDIEEQLKGKDFIVKSNGNGAIYSVQVKYDYECAKFGPFVQTHETSFRHIG